MFLRKISWKNVGPYGNKFQTIEFDPNGGLWMITGKNGNGKSFLVNLPKILYYGKLDRFKKDDIANRLNKHGWILGEVETSPGINVTIERDLSPSDLKVFKYKNGEEASEENDIGKAGIKNYQDYIDNEVTGLPYHIFSNIISLSVNDFKSFISMSPTDKRAIIDKLFATEMINVMSDLIKRDLRDVKINIDLYDREIMSLNSSIESAKRELEKLKERLKENSQKRLDEIIIKLKEIKPKIEDAVKKLGEFTDKENEIKKGRDAFLIQKKNAETEISSIEKKIKLYNQDKCPTCETPFSDNRFDILKGELNSEIGFKKESYIALLTFGPKYEEGLSKIGEAKSKLNEFIYQAKNLFGTLTKEFNELKGNSKTEEFKSIENIISKNTIGIKKKEEEKSDLDSKNKYLVILLELYSDSGIKKRILESYLPTLNKEIDFTLNELHFPYSLKFNSDFEPILNHLGIDINVDTLSTGEKKRVDLAVLVSIIRMLKRKFPLLNIFMLDEVLSSIDSDGIYDIIGLLRRTSLDLKMNIFIINHSPLPVEYFSYRIEIQKNGGFSDLNIEKLDE